jgi:two-component system, OmpR family, sensor kinase
VRLPIRTRLTLVFAVLSAVVVGIAAVALVLGFRATQRASVDDRLRTRFAALEADPRAVESSSFGEEEFAQYIEPDGSLLAGPGPAERLLPPGVTSGVDELRFYSEDVAVDSPEEVEPVRILAGPVDGGVLIVAADVEDQAEAASRLLAIVAIGGPILVGVLAGLGWLLAGAALRPVERLREEASAISSSEPDRRLPVPATGDELQRLAETLNAMLDRLHEALDRERRFVDEASHELRTPLGVLSAEVELARRQARTPEELVAALSSIEQETDRLRRLTQDLLVLARSDRGRLPVHREDVDVSAMIARVVDAFEDRARRSGVSVRSGGDGVHAHVDADRLRQAVENLVDNGIRYAGDGGRVDVQAERVDGRLHVVVRDSGAGFSPELLDRIFEPFARADGDRAGDGAGLGLAIVRAVAEAHGGSATARNLDDGGASVELDLPA